MKLIIPMAGRGSRLRPHTLTVPKPLIPFSGKPMVQRMAEDLATGTAQKFEEISFVIGDFGEEAEKMLSQIGENIDTPVRIYYQKEPLGTAHAIHCAADSLNGPVMVAFADTLFRGAFHVDDRDEGIIWAKRVDNPSAYGVLKLDGHGMISGFVEKPENFVSDLAIVGIYYFKHGETLKKEIEYLLNNDIREKGEFQLTNALDRMRQNGTSFRPGTIEAWLDCGNKDALIAANRDVLEHADPEPLQSRIATITESVIIEPCYIGNGARIEQSVIGPFVSVGENTTIKKSIVSNSIIQQDVMLHHVHCSNSMIGRFASCKGTPKNWSIGDYTKLEE